VTVAITIDVDGEAGLPDGGAAHAELLSSRSERLYGIARGLPRILSALDEFGVSATFYVPGITALRHRDEIAALAASRHEVQHHGHSHRRPNTMTVQEQRDDVRAGIEALVDVTGRRPRGYRAPGWELTPATLVALVGERFAFDSSLMGDDAPYRVASGGGELVELPVHWSLDDAPHFARASDVDGLLAVWLSELRTAVRASRHLTLTVHPEIIGRPHRIDVLRRLFDAAGGIDARWETHAAIAEDVASA
jgi:peptidoglycan/xylan/chitin deacetylase (PgdA/CDA1 family)